MTIPPVSRSDDGPSQPWGEHDAAKAPVVAEANAPVAAEPSAPSSPVAQSSGSDPQAVSLTPFVWRLLVVGVASIVVGVAAGLLWHALVDLPVYRVGSDGGAATTERGLAAVFGTDAAYSAIGAFVGVGIGVASWRLFGHRGWVVTLIAVAAAVTAALICWGVGVAQGPSDFAARIAAAGNGDQVPIDFALHTKSAIYIWPLFAVGAVMFASAFGRERTRGW